ncbi:MAG: hypothetical protein ABIW46_02855 [Acidimicrobiales bacterium]
MVLGRLDVDALVHLAVRGPIGAVDWRPAVPDAIPSVLVARADRDPHEPMPEPESITALRSRWRDVGLPLAHVTVMRPEYQTYDHRIVGAGSWSPSGSSGFATLGVSSCVGSVRGCEPVQQPGARADHLPPQW